MYLLAYNHSQIMVYHSKKLRVEESRHRTSPTFPEIISSFSFFIPSFLFLFNLFVRRKKTSDDAY